jgi:DNA-binding NarL/FixJ family response regulator
MKPQRVLVAEDHQLVRAGFRALLNGFEGVDVVAEASDGQETLLLIPTVNPDIVLMDISMPLLNGIETTHRISREFPEVRVIILSMYTTEEYVLQALRAGATGYLLKDSAPEEFDQAIQAVARGETYLCSGIAEHVVAYIRRTKSKLTVEQASTDPYVHLTSRQRQILQMVAEGNKSSQIAEALHISLKTVERHRADIMERLDIHDLPGLVRYAIRSGIIGLDT